MIDTDIKESRLFFYRLIKDTFASEPTEKYFDMTKNFVENLADISNDIEKLSFITESFNDVFNKYGFKDLKDEYDKVFIDPFNDNLINLNASYYMDGKNFGKTLADVREFIWNMNLIRDENVSAPEDSVAFICDVMVYLVENACIETQKTFFDRFVEPFFIKFSKTLKENELSNFYACMGEIVSFLTDTEKSYFEESKIL